MGGDSLPEAGAAPFPGPEDPSPWEDRPRLLFWETTKACLLACRHCRAEAQREPLPGQLLPQEAEAVLDQVVEFGRPYPVLVFTGGDVLMRPDAFHLLEGARARGIPRAVSPSVTPRLTDEALSRFASVGVHAMSLSLDGDPATHDELRGVPGTYARTLAALRAARAGRIPTQVNTVVMRRTVEHLPHVAALLLAEGVGTWEVFFLIATGRAQAAEDLTPPEWGDVCRFLLDVTAYGLTVRAVEAPFFRRTFAERERGTGKGGALYRRLARRLREMAGQPRGAPHLSRSGTLDGDGILFLSHDGWMFPGGFLPVRLGNVRRDRLAQVYQSHPLLQSIRRRELEGPCGECPWRRVCGGSRARAYAAFGSPLASDPACPWAAEWPRSASP